MSKAAEKMQLLKKISACSSAAGLMLVQNTSLSNSSAELVLLQKHNPTEAQRNKHYPYFRSRHSLSLSSHRLLQCGQFRYITEGGVFRSNACTAAHSGSFPVAGQIKSIFE